MPRFFLYSLNHNPAIGDARASVVPIWQNFEPLASLREFLSRAQYVVYLRSRNQKLAYIVDEYRVEV
jgi:hypothetical protein